MSPASLLLRISVYSDERARLSRLQLLCDVTDVF